MIKVVEKPWGKEEWLALTKSYCFKKITVYKGCKTSLQYHTKKEETIYITKGNPLLTTANDACKVYPGFILHCEPGYIHRLEAIDEDIEFFEASSPEVDDVVRLEDSYGRQ